MSDTSFLEFRKDHAEELRQVQIFLAGELPDDPAMLKQALAKAVPAYARTNVILGWAVSFHKMSRAAKLKPKSFGGALEREVQMDADTADERRYREIWEGVEKSLKAHMSACQTLISFAKEEMSILSGGRG